MNVAERFSSRSKEQSRRNGEGENGTEQRNPISENVREAICESINISPFRSIVKGKRPASELSNSLGAKRFKDSDTSRLIKDEPKTTNYSNCDENVSTYGRITQSSSFSSTINVVPPVQLITPDSYDDENDSKSSTAIRSSSSLSSSIGMLQEEQIMQDTSGNEDAGQDDISTEHSKSESGNPIDPSYRAPPRYPGEESVFECAHCDSSFSQSHDLYFHTRIHGKPFICKKCTRPYYDCSGFIHHIERHARIVGIPLSCAICNQGFCGKVHLNQHMVLEHKVKYSDLT